MPTPDFLLRLASHVRRAPSRPALHFRGEWMTYGELARATARAADALNAGLRRDEQMLLVAPKSPDTIALLLAAWHAGYQVLVPSPELGEQAIQDLAERVGSGAIVRLGDGRLATFGVEHRAPALTDASPAWDADLLLTTSGTTGVPKVVPIDRAGADRFFSWAAANAGTGRGARVLSYAPLNFDVSLLDVWATLSRGGATVLVDHDTATDGAALAELMTATGVTVAQAVPLAFRLISAAAPAPLLDLERILLTGDVTPPELASMLPELAPRARVHNVYGSTETNNSIWHEIPPQQLASGEPLAIGRPLDGAQAHLVDDDHRVVDGAGEGELWTSTPFQCRGYLDPVATAAAFVPDPLGTSRTFYRTGDLATRDASGVLRLTGRLDHQVKVNGVRTNLAAVEAVLRAADGVADAVVVAVPDDAAGHLLHAVVQRRPGSALNSLLLRSHAAPHLPRTAIPRAYTIADDPLPRTATGKVDRQAVTRDVITRTQSYVTT